MINCYNFYKLDPFIFIGKKIANYFEKEKLENRITNFIRSIFIGIAMYFACPYLFSISLSKRFILSVSNALIFFLVQERGMARTIKRYPEIYT